MVKIDTNIAEVTRDLNDLGHRVADDTQDALDEVGRFVRDEARIRCPKGATKADAASDPQYRCKNRKGRSPGTLEQSISVKGGHGYVDVGVMSGNALQYANKIHNGRGTDWNRLGPGSKRKQSGARVGEKFVDRAYDENEKEIVGKFDKGVNMAVNRFNGNY